MSVVHVHSQQKRLVVSLATYLTAVSLTMTYIYMPNTQTQKHILPFSAAKPSSALTHKLTRDSPSN